MPLSKLTSHMLHWLDIVQALEYLLFTLLLVLSIWSIAIMIDRRRFWKGISANDGYANLKTALEGFSRPGAVDRVKVIPHLGAKLIVRLSEYRNSTPAELERVARSFYADQKLEIEKGHSVLATLGANAPFIGLLGTVLGIVKAFAALSSQQGSSFQVMSSISFALVATAAGLFVAIPAVVAYNVFSQKFSKMLIECESLKELFILHGLSKNQHG